MGLYVNIRNEMSYIGFSDKSIRKWVSVSYNFPAGHKKNPDSIFSN